MEEPMTFRTWTNAPRVALPVIGEPAYRRSDGVIVRSYADEDRVYEKLTYPDGTIRWAIVEDC
jgi:hypothetical protein